MSLSAARLPAYILGALPSIPFCLLNKKSCVFGFLLSSSFFLLEKKVEAERGYNCLLEDHSSTLSFGSQIIDIGLAGIGYKVNKRVAVALQPNQVAGGGLSKMVKLVGQILGSFWSGATLGFYAVNLGNDAYCSFTGLQTEQSKSLRIYLNNLIESSFKSIENQHSKNFSREELDLYQKFFFDNFLSKYGFDLQNLPENLTSGDREEVINYIQYYQIMAEFELSQRRLQKTINTINDKTIEFKGAVNKLLDSNSPYKAMLREVAQNLSLLNEQSIFRAQNSTNSTNVA